VVLRQPDAVVMIDAQGFAKRLGLRLAGSTFPLIQYVAPTVWAWKPWRARTVSRYLAHLLTIFPFEGPYFARHGLASTFVGHPAAENAWRRGDRFGFRQLHAIPQDAPVICALPGSRLGEIARHAPIIDHALRLLKAEFPNLHALTPTVASVAAQVSEAVRSWPVPTIVLPNLVDKYEGFAAADVALAASGTVTAETALAELPTVVMYKINPVVARLGHWLFKNRALQFASPVNIIAGREIMPEFIQYTCSPANLAGAVARLLRDSGRRADQIAELRTMGSRMAVDGERPSRIAARAVLGVIEEWRSRARDRASSPPVGRKADLVRLSSRA
jgi:lipid-A-disaccharide synthase